MRLWHESLIPHLDRQRLLGQHRECCALRGNGWGKKHATVDYVFKYSPLALYLYHEKVMEEMRHRGYVCDSLWCNPHYRGKTASLWVSINSHSTKGKFIYPEHNEAYLQGCLNNLRNKGIEIGGVA